MDTLQQKAIAVLEGNWQGTFTIPRHKLYPFQWNWDSGFTMLGQQYYDLNHAMQELRSILSGQWDNGMIPHIIFHSESEETYFPNWDFWETTVNSGAPQQPKTSGITQPPVFGFVLRELWSKFSKDSRFRDFCREVIPKVIDFHYFFYNYRDPHKEGLLHIIHPWESGRDNSPLWDTALDRLQVDKDALPPYQRKDTEISDATERPTSDHYDRYVYLLDYAKRQQYDGPKLRTSAPFRVQDTMMNALLIKSNEDILFLCQELGISARGLEEKQALSVANYHKKFWNHDLQWHCCYDLTGKTSIAHREIGGLTALFAGVVGDSVVKGYDNYLQDLHDRNYYLCPSFDVESPLFDSKRYWRGPIWPQMNWLVAKGMDRYGYDNTAQLIRSDLTSLVEQHGFYEYFEAQKDVNNTNNKGYGGDQFSWTASCILDIINSSI